MKPRYCFGDYCRDLTPVRPKGKLYCATCAPLVRADRHREAFHRYLNRERETHNERARRWYHANRERDLARRKAYAKEVGW